MNLKDHVRSSVSMLEIEEEIIGKAIVDPVLWVSIDLYSDLCKTLNIDVPPQFANARIVGFYCFTSFIKIKTVPDISNFCFIGIEEDYERIIRAIVDDSFESNVL